MNEFEEKPFLYIKRNSLDKFKPLKNNMKFKKRTDEEKSIFIIFYRKSVSPF
jgi:hypothetical protein